ncbi:aspartate dehydrogenase [Salipiger sp.]|uniref:aspartate dehydrogenase n=1 Tax=Salipiger sp. TaxID=2078585 RepID=UPI003A978FE6
MSARIATIGFGAMARSLAAALARHDGGPRVTDCLLRPDSATDLPEGVTACTDIAALIAKAPDLVVECAGHAALAETVPALLRAGLDVVVVSLGALCDDALRAEVMRAAAEGAARLIPVAGAVGGLDLLRAARLAGLDAVTYRGIKPAGAWAGSPAADAVDLGGLAQATVVFSGTAREAALRFPKNANVAAAVAFAGLGLDATRVELIADPAGTANRHEIAATGAFGEMAFSVTNRPLPGNPKTSHLAALSAEEAVLAVFAAGPFGADAAPRR